MKNGVLNNNGFPGFTVLMSVYKKETPKFLDDSLKSVENQTVAPNQIVLVEDGPLEQDLINIIEKHRSAYYKVYDIVKLEKNQGLGLALRTGTKIVKNEWIARMDTDDIAVRNRFETQLKEIIKHPKLSIVGGQVDEFSGSISQIVGRRNVPLTEKRIKSFAKWRNPFNHPTILIKKKDLESVGGYSYYGNVEDYFLWIRMINAGFHMKNLPQVLVHMRVDTGLYGRRGNLKNMKHFIKLRKYMRKKRLVTFSEEISGDLIIFLNIVIPQKFRKCIYQLILHR